MGKKQRQKKEKERKTDGVKGSLMDDCLDSYVYDRENENEMYRIRFFELKEKVIFTESNADRLKGEITAPERDGGGERDR